MAWTIDQAEERLGGARGLVQYASTLHPIAGSKFLDVGCGFGNTMLAALEAGAAEAVGIDIDPAMFDAPMFDELSRRHQIPSENAKFIEGDFCNLTQYDDYFDVAISFDAIEHVRDPDQFAQRMFQVVKKGGLALIDCGALYYCYAGGHVWGYFKLEEMPWVHLYEDYPELLDKAQVSDWMREQIALLNKLTYGRFRRAVEKSGFEIVREHGSEYGRDIINQYRDRIDFTQVPSEEDLFKVWTRFDWRKP